jgi:hypothetical protein
MLPPRRCDYGDDDSRYAVDAGQLGVRRVSDISRAARKGPPSSRLYICTISDHRIDRPAI